MVCWQWKTFDDHSYPYLSGHGYSVSCRYILNYDGFKINPNAKPEQNNWVFVHTNHIDDFFYNLNKDASIVLFTHNSDYPINEKHLNYINDPRLIVWFAINVEIEHPKLKSIPIGINPPGFPCGDASILTKIVEENNKKQNMFYSNFSVNNNKKDREQCLSETKVCLSENKLFEDYLRDISKSYFCISPQGNGIDCHRTWESLYLKTIPIVTKSHIVDTHKDMPIIILDDWSDFKNINFNEELYYKIWNNFDTSNLHKNNYLTRIISQIP